MAVGSELGSAQPRSGRTPYQGALAARRLCRRVLRRSLRASLQRTQKSLLSRRRGWAHPVAWLGRGLDFGAERLRRRRQDGAGCRRRGQFRADEQSAAGGEGRRPQLPRNIERRRLASHLDAPHERSRPARRVPRRRLRRKSGAATGRVDRARRNLGTRLPGGDDQGRPLCARRRLHDGRRRRPRFWAAASEVSRRPMGWPERACWRRKS